MTDRLHAYNYVTRDRLNFGGLTCTENLNKASRLRTETEMFRFLVGNRECVSPVNVLIFKLM
ncbi:hypothetical protein DNTS_025206 [Danionella cerebrum]|uniref:Uncharacterized protein n=1 Tax=Danionella cerebrum TaxID=2873325 RepID=A0A553Q4C4_9TELE|nr:hypothetical protein DNTS_025206 [Danionella translucida]